MPIFEYACKDCGTPYEVLHKTSENSELVVCPSCQSTNAAKKLSAFSASMGSQSDSSCASGSCGMPSYSPCASGMCGLN